MDYFFSAETDQDVSDRIHTVLQSMNRVFPNIIEQLRLDRVNVDILYVPIIMDPKFAVHFPARSRGVKTKRKYYCSPQLDHGRFVKGGLEERLDVYFEGLNQCLPHLEKLGLSGDEVALIKEAFDLAHQSLLAEP